MVFADLAFAFLVALMLSFVLAVVLGHPGSGKAAQMFFLILLMTTWAGGVSLVPFGPTLWGVHWVGFLAVGIVVTLFILAFAVRPSPVIRPPSDTTQLAEAASMFGAAVWVLLVFLMLPIVAHYLTVTR